VARIRQVDDVSIVEWDDSRLPATVAALRKLLDEAGDRLVLVDMSGSRCASADNLETLTEAATVCRDRGCTVGMYGLDPELAQLVEVMGLGEFLPPIVGRAEDDAVASIQGENGEPIQELEIDLSAAPTARYDALAEAATPPDGIDVASAGPQADSDLLMVDWADLTRTGYTVGGPKAEAIADATAGVAKGPPPTPPLREGEDYIDIDGDALGGAGGPSRPFQTEVLPAFQLDEGKGWSAKPQGGVGADFDAGDLSAEPAGVFGGEVGDFSPVDTDDGPPAFLKDGGSAAAEDTRPFGVPLQEQGDAEGTKAFKIPLQPQAEGTKPFGVPLRHEQPDGDESPRSFGTPRQGQEAGAGAPPQQPPAGGPFEDTSPYYAGDEDDQTVMFQPGALAAGLEAAGAGGPFDAEGGDAAYQGGVFGEDSDDQMVMFQPGAQELAMLADAAAQATPPPAGGQAPGQQVPPGTPPDGQQQQRLASFLPEDESDDQTVMFQPGAFDAALLAEVAAAAGPESRVPEPEVADPPARDRGPAAEPDLSEDEAEVRDFVHDYAISSQIHVQMLERFMKAGEETLGPADLQSTVGGSRTEMSRVLDQLVQSRLVRRTRSPRVRGGTGFVFSPSPRNRSTVVSLLKLWDAPSGRSRVSTWLDQATT